MVTADIQILDYTNSQLIPLNIGQAKIQTGNFKLIHDINIGQYQETVSEIESILDQNEIRGHTLYPYLIHELTQLKDLIHNLTPKTKRSINVIGTAWKWLAGTPDHEDFVTIKQKINNVLENNNKQVIINSLFNNRINNITRIINQIQNFVQKDQIFGNEFLESIQYKIKLLKEDLINVNYAIHWAKTNVVNSMMLTSKEISLAIKNLDEEKLPYSTPEEALNFATVKILTNKISLLYIVNIPITKRKPYHAMLIKPVKKYNVIIDTPHNIITDENFDEIYTPLNTCNKNNDITICTQTNLINLKENSCITNILKSRESICNKLINHQVPSVEEISTGILLINDFNGTINVDNIPRNIKGTFILKFSNSTISIGELSFTSTISSTIQILPAVLHPTPRESQYREILSLESMRDVHINNTKHIQLLAEDRDVHKWALISLAPIIFILFIAMAAIHIWNRQGPKITIKTPNFQENQIKNLQPNLQTKQPQQASFF